jgi:hypothetical protein
VAAPSPPYNPEAGSPREVESYFSLQRSQPQQQQQQQQQQEQPPSPRKFMFDFVSLFDALASTSTVKKKPVPQPVSTSSGNEDAWTDSKRKSVENLIDQLTWGQGHNSGSVQTSSMQDPQLFYGPYMTDKDIAEPVQSRVPPPPLPPKPNRTASPCSSPPKVNATHRPQPQPTHLADSPISAAGVPTSQVPMGSIRKDQENPLLFRGSFNAKSSPGKSKKSVESQVCSHIETQLMPTQ